MIPFGMESPNFLVAPAAAATAAATTITKDNLFVASSSVNVNIL
jgi:hypothetical protein